jgi:hypothetical protein
LARKRLRLQRVSISARAPSTARQVPRLDMQLETTERLMPYDFRIRKMNNVFMPRDADESGTG